MSSSPFSLAKDITWKSVIRPDKDYLNEVEERNRNLSLLRQIMDEIYNGNNININERNIEMDIRTNGERSYPSSKEGKYYRNKKIPQKKKKKETKPRERYEYSNDIENPFRISEKQRYLRWEVDETNY